MSQNVYFSTSATNDLIWDFSDAWLSQDDADLDEVTSIFIDSQFVCHWLGPNVVNLSFWLSQNWVKTYISVPVLTMASFETFSDAWLNHDVDVWDEIASTSIDSSVCCYKRSDIRN